MRFPFQYLAINLLFIVSLAPAGITGILEGRVVDKNTKEPLVGVTIFFSSLNQGGTTDTEGYYQVKNIRAGVYDVRFTIIGYKTVAMTEVTIFPDLRTRVNVEMEQSSVELDVVEVRAERPLIQKDLAATAYSIGEIKIEKLPISAFKDILALQPGTTIEGNVRGGKTTEVVFLVDGLPVQDVVGGGLGMNLPKSSISGMTVHTGGFDAEYGNALSGVVNVVTKMGSERPAYSIRFEKDDWLPNGWNQQIDRATEIELSATGPIIPEKLRYFTANSVLASDTRWWQDFQHFFESPITQEFSGFSKVEYEFSPMMRLSFQGIYSLRRWHDYEFSWRFNLNGLPARARDSYRLAAVFSQTLSENSYYTISLSRYFQRSEIGEGSKYDLTLEPYEYDFFLRYILDGNRNWWADTRQAIYTLKGDITTQIDKLHLLKIGAELNQYAMSSDVVKYEPQLTYFGKPITDAPLLNYSNTYKYLPRSGSVFIQDKVELVRDGSNFSAGIRWDFLDPTAERPLVEFVPVSQTQYQEQVKGTAPATIKHQFSPRLSFAGPIGTTSFFFINFGHYFQYPLFDYLYSGINPVQLREGTKNVLTGNPDLEPERTVSWELGFKHSLNDRTVGSITYFRKMTKNQIDSKTLIPFDSKAAGDFGFASYVNNAEANSSGLELLISREHDEKLSGSVSYSYMVTEGISEYVDQRINYAQWGFPLATRAFPLSWDQRHTIKADGEFVLPWEIHANVIFLYNSARPYTYFPTRDGFTPTDPTKVLLPNNARMEDNLFFNAKLSKQIVFGIEHRYVVTLFADARNLINKKNVRWIDSSGRIGGELGDPSAYYDPRRVRVGAKVEF